MNALFSAAGCDFYPERRSGQAGRHSKLRAIRLRIQARQGDLNFNGIYPERQFM